MDRSIVHGIAWLALIKWSGQIVAWGSTFIVGRLLTPADYGIVGAASLYLGLLAIVSEFGIGSAVVLMRTLTPSQLRQINTVSVLFGMFGVALTAVLAHWIAVFFHSPTIGPVVLALSSTFLISSFRIVPWALLQRDMRFKRVAVFEGIQTIALAVLSIVLAMAGYRYWTLVIASIASTAIPTIFALVLHRVGFKMPRWSEIRGAVSLSKDIIVQRLAWYFYTDSDFLVAGRVLGQQALGAYTMAWSISNAPIDKIGRVVFQVMPSVLSAVREDRAATARYVAATTEAVAALTFPLFIGIAIVAPEFVPVVLGEKWMAIITPLQILSAYTCFRVILPILAQVLTVRGEAKFAANNTLLAAMVLPLAFLFASRWGITGISLAWVVVHPLIAYRLCARALTSIGMTFGEFFAKSVWPAISSCLLMIAAVVLVRHLIPQTAAGWIGLLAEVFAGAAVYVGALLLLHRARVQVLMQMVRQGRAAAA